MTLTLQRSKSILHVLKNYLSPNFLFHTYYNQLFSCFFEMKDCQIKIADTKNEFEHLSVKSTLYVYYKVSCMY